MAKKNNLDWENLKSGPDSQWGGTVENILKQMSAQHHVSTGPAFNPNSPQRLPEKETGEEGAKSWLGGGGRENKTGGIQSALLGGGDDPNNPIVNNDGTITMGVGKTAKTFKNREEYNSHMNHQEQIKTKPIFEKMPDGSTLYASNQQDLIKQKNNWLKTYKTIDKNKAEANKEFVRSEKINSYVSNGWTLNGEQVSVSKERANQLVDWENMEATDLLEERMNLLKYFDKPTGNPDDEDYHAGSDEYANASDSHRAILKVKLDDIDQILTNRGQTIKETENLKLGIVLTDNSEETKQKYDNAKDEDLITINGETKTKSDWEKLRIEKKEEIDKMDEKEIIKNTEVELIKPPPRPHVVIEAEDEDFDMPIMIMNNFTGEEEEFNKENSKAGAYDSDLEEFEQYVPPVFGEGNAIKKSSPNSPWVFGNLPDGTQSWMYIGDDWEGEGKNNIMNAVNWDDYYEDRVTSEGGKEYGVPKSDTPSQEDRDKENRPTWADEDEPLIGSESDGGIIQDPGEILDDDTIISSETTTEVIPGIPQTFPKKEDETKTNFVEIEEEEEEEEEKDDSEENIKKKVKKNVNSGSQGQQDEWEENL